MTSVESLVADKAHLRAIAPGVHAFIGERGDSNAGAIETPDGLVIIDTQQHLPLAQTFRSALRATLDRPIRLVVDTHYHLDHTAGNVLFREEAPILAHARTTDKMNAILGDAEDGRWELRDFKTRARLLFGPNLDELIPEGDPAWDWFAQRLGDPAYQHMVIVAPDETFEGSREVDLGGSAGVMRLDYTGPAHCDGDLIVYLSETRVAFLGDLLFSGRFPWIGDGDVAGWVRALDHVLGLDVDVIVPGHGLPVTLAEVAAFRDMLSALLDAVSAQVAQGASEDAAAAEVSLPEYEALPRYREWMSWNVRNTYRGVRAAAG